MKLRMLEPKDSLPDSLKKHRINPDDFNNFKKRLSVFLAQIDSDQYEEHNKNDLISFLNDAFYGKTNYINIHKRNDLVIRIGKEAYSKIGVIIEAKRPEEKRDMLSRDNINVKALHELILYYLRERITSENNKITHLIATDFYQWFLFDAQVFEKLFFKNTNFRKDFNDFEAGRLSSRDTKLFYDEIAAPYVAGLTQEIKFTYFDLRDCKDWLSGVDPAGETKLITLYKTLSPEHLLKQNVANDSNALNKDFYAELLHIIGLKQVAKGGKKLIQRKEAGERNRGSLLENAIDQLELSDRINHLSDPEKYGKSNDERLFNVGLELCISWMNRILFLKLMEAQLVKYHGNDKSLEFLRIDKIPYFGVLNRLFFKVLALKNQDRDESLQKTFGHVPYLNSSLFEVSDVERNFILISSLSNDRSLPLHPKTVIRDESDKVPKGEMGTLKYLLEFLRAYDFSSEGSEEFQEKDKDLISASVLGLIFEKINGYKDGSYFTPGFITEYMCRETIKRAILQKFKEAKGWDYDNLTDLHNKIEPTDIKEANKIVNDLKVCDPAVGSGHFLVSALNEIIAVKQQLGILTYRDGRKIDDYEIRVADDELMITDNFGKQFQYERSNRKSQRLQEALFHEKQTIIENCLFGVDINPNSVNICRLRLWIELLKNAYYKEVKGFKELETLPNIDINIKCGNSLVSRFALDADLGKALRKSKWSIEDYQVAVQSYRRARTGEEKHAMRRLIDDIKSSFSSQIHLNDPIKKRLDSLSSELYHRFTGPFLFEPEVGGWGKNSEDPEKKREREQNKLEQEIEKLQEQLNEKKGNEIFRNAFEWRFEFPEVLNNDGDFVGFDVVIGNPPYGVKLGDREKEYLKKKYIGTSGEVEIYTFFIELVMTDLLKNNGTFSFITTNTIYYLDKFSQIRKKAFLCNRIISLLELEKQVFADAPDIVPAIYVLQKNASKNNMIKLFKSIETNRVYDLVEFEGFKTNSIEQKIFIEKKNFVFSLSTNEAKENLLKRISQFDTIKKSFKVVYGIKTGDNSRFLSKKITGNENWKKCASSAKNIKKFLIEWQGDYLNVCNDLAGLNNINYEQPKILIQYIRKLSMPVRLVCALDQIGEYYPLNNFSFVISENDYSLKVLLGMLNSRFMNWYFSNCFVDYNIKPKYIEQLPLPTNIISSEIEHKVDEIITLKEKHKLIDTMYLENEIDQLVYQLYELTDEEIQIIENS